MFLEKEACLVPFLEFGGPVDQFKLRHGLSSTAVLTLEKIHMTH
jgi:hypothetical protein